MGIPLCAAGGPLVGRDGEVHSVLEAARRAATGHGSVALVAGEAGIGKTALVRALVPELARSGLQVCIGAADVLETHLPFSAIGDCLDLNRRSGDSRRAKVVAQFRGEAGDGSGTPAVGHEFALVQLVIALVEDLCEQGPVALVLDDAQWADTQSLLCLQRLSRLVEQLPLLVLLAIHSGQSTPQLDQLLESLSARGSTTITLRPLPEEEVDQLLALLTGAAAGPVLRQVAADAAGNPFYITALVDALNAGQRIRVRGDTAEAAQGADLGSLHSVIMRRLGFLPTEVVELLRAAALLGGRFSVGELAAATGRSPQEVFPRLEVAERAGVVIEVGEHLAFQHDLVRLALVETLTVSARQAMHQRLGLALAAVGQPVERVADQLRRSGAALGNDGLQWLAGAADRLVARDRDTAVELLQRALPAADPADPRVQRLWVVWAHALLNQGRAQECARVATQALAQTPDPHLRTQLRWILVHHARAADRTDPLSAAQAGIRLAQEAADHPDTSPAERLQFMAHCALRLADNGEYGRARQIAQEVRTSGADLADATAVSAVSQALEVLALVEECAKRPGRAWELLKQLPGHRRVLDTFRASALLDLGRLQEAVAVLRHPSGYGAGAESVADMLWQHLYSAYVQFVGGLWDDAMAEIEAGQELPEYGDARRGLCGLGALIAVHRGDLPAAEEYLARAPVHSPYTPGDAFTGSFPRWAHACYEQYCGRPAQALELFEHLCRHDSWDLHAVWLTVLPPEAVRLALQTGHPDRARQMHAFLLDQAESAEPGVLDPGLLHCQGLLDSRADALLAAADACDRLHRPWHAARCHEDTAALMAQRGHRDEARHELDLAAAGYQGLDAAWDLSRIDAALRGLGFRRGVRGPRRRPSHGWDALTATERKVADLVAEGLSNPHIGERLFISRRTVQTHVSHILAKLDMTSRVEIAAHVTAHSTH
ncbi:MULTISPECIES: AAA family ATPase [unclassified Streptomyces]|uniref:helix-turn-helix transcriptional regulator n=1 Tax=unclassified Streptomyces TaxID=2593676 RepID=UPI0038075365